MRRRYNTARFVSRIAAVRAQIPDVFFGVDVIVGFPGETDEDFEQTYRFLAQEVHPAFLHVFPYSIRPNTPAALMPNQVQSSVATQRVDRLNALSARLYREFASAHLGKEAKVLWESTRHGGKMFGFTENYIKVAAPFDRERINTITSVRLERLDDESLVEATILSD